MDIFGQIAIVLAVCVLAGGLATALRLPPLVGLLLAGIAVGPQGLGVVAATEEIALLGEIGIVLLLFVVGLELDPRVVRRLGPSVLAIGLTQVAITAAIGFGIATATGASPVAAAYLAAAVAFSSTVVVIKLLGDRRELEHLHGRLAIGILIIQDLVVVALLITVAATAGELETSVGAQVLTLSLRGAALLGIVWLLSRTVLPAITQLLARQPELLVLAAVTWSVALAAAAHLLGFSAEVGAIVAGVALATSPYREAMAGRLTTLRDFLLVFFFIDLGTKLELGGSGGGVATLVALTIFVLLGKPLLIAVLTTAAGFRARVGVHTGLDLSQISEFSLILAAVGVGAGQLDAGTAGTVTLLAVITITISTLLSARSKQLVPALSPTLLWLEKATPTRDLAEDASEIAPTVIIVGLGRLGQRLAKRLHEAGEVVLGVDFDPRHHRLPAGEPAVIYGDAEDPELPTHLPLDQAEWVISTLRDERANRTLAGSLVAYGFAGRLAVSTDHEHEIAPLERAGADLVIRPLHAAVEPLLREIAEHRTGSP